jgi:hypothetical protein
MAVETIRPTSTSDTSADYAGVAVSRSNTNLANAYDNNPATYATQQVQAQDFAFSTNSSSYIHYILPAKTKVWTSWTANFTIDWSLVAGAAASGSLIVIDLYDSTSSSLGTGTQTFGPPLSGQTKTTLQITGTGDIPNFAGGWFVVFLDSKTNGAPSGTADSITAKIYEVWVDGTYPGVNGDFFAFF